MSKAQNHLTNTAKVSVVTNILNVKHPEIGELYYSLANSGRLYIWTVAGWKYAAFT